MFLNVKKRGIENDENKIAKDSLQSTNSYSIHTFPMSLDANTNVNLPRRKSVFLMKRNLLVLKHRAPKRIRT